MTLLYGVAPPLMAWSLREGGLAAQPSSAAQRAGPIRRALRGAAAVEPMLPGGRAVLAGLCASATCIEIGRAIIDSGINVQQTLGSGCEGFLLAATCCWTDRPVNLN
jgi:hypothetical protein